MAIKIPYCDTGIVNFYTSHLAGEVIAQWLRVEVLHEAAATATIIATATTFVGFWLIAYFSADHSR